MNGERGWCLTTIPPLLRKEIMTEKLVFPKALCEVCNAEFTKTRSNRVCCSHKCSAQLWSKRKGKAYFRDRYKSNPRLFIQYGKDHVQRLKDIVYNAYGGYRCNCLHCHETNPKFLTLDHVNNDGAEHRKLLSDRSGGTLYRWIIKNNFPPMFQILCYNCNCGKNVNGGICPHFGDIK